MSKKGKGCRPGFKKKGGSCMLNGWTDKRNMVFQKGSHTLKITRHAPFDVTVNGKSLGTRNNLGKGYGLAYNYMKKN